MVIKGFKSMLFASVAGVSIGAGAGWLSANDFKVASGSLVGGISALMSSLVISKLKTEDSYHAIIVGHLKELVKSEDELNKKISEDTLDRSFAKLFYEQKGLVTLTQLAVSSGLPADLCATYLSSKLKDLKFQVVAENSFLIDGHPEPLLQAAQQPAQLTPEQVYAYQLQLQQQQEAAARAAWAAQQQQTPEQPQTVTVQNNDAQAWSNLI